MTSKEAIDDLSRRLRDAAQRLVIATVHARQLPPEAEVANECQKELIISKGAHSMPGSAIMILAATRSSWAFPVSWSLNRIALISLSFSGAFWPTSLPLFQGADDLEISLCEFMRVSFNERTPIAVKQAGAHRPILAI